MSLNKIDGRIRIKRSTITGETPTLGPTTDYTDGAWTSSTQIYTGEFFLNEPDQRLWIGTVSGVTEIELLTSSGGTDYDFCATGLKTSAISGCSPIDIYETMRITTGHSITTSNGGGQIDLDAFGNPNEVLITNDSGAYADSGGDYGIDLSTGGIQISDNVGTGIGITDTVRGLGINIGEGVLQASDTIVIQPNTTSITTSPTANAANVLINSKGSTILSGVTNSVVVGGVSNSATTSNSTVSGGEGNIASGSMSAVVGGKSNTASGNYSFVSGYGNTPSGNYSFVSGGYTNEASNYSAAVLAGTNNLASGPKSSVIGGSSNTASGNNSSVIGGNDHLVSGSDSAIIGGGDHINSGTTSVIMGGSSNKVNSGVSDSTILGGQGIRATTSQTVYVPNLNIQEEKNIIVGTGGTNPSAGVATMVAGVVVVSTTNVEANSLIMLTPQNTSGTAGSVYVSARTGGTSFTITSTNVLDTRDIAWVIIKQ